MKISFASLLIAVAILLTCNAANADVQAIGEILHQGKHFKVSFVTSGRDRSVDVYIQDQYGVNTNLHNMNKQQWASFVRLYSAALTKAPRLNPEVRSEIGTVSDLQVLAANYRAFGQCVLFWSTSREKVDRILFVMNGDRCRELNRIISLVNDRLR